MLMHRRSDRKRTITLVLLPIVFTRKAKTDVRDITYEQTPRPQDLTMKRAYAYQLEVIVGAIGMATAAIEFYEVRELVAALIIFTLLFGTLAVALLTLVLIQRTVLKGLTQFESCAVYVRAQHAALSIQRRRIIR